MFSSKQLFFLNNVFYGVPVVIFTAQMEWSLEMQCCSRFIRVLWTKQTLCSTSRMVEVDTVVITFWEKIIITEIFLTVFKLSFWILVGCILE